MNTKLFYPHIVSLLNTLVIALMLTGCDSVYRNHRAYQIPSTANDGLEVGSLTDVNLDTTKILKAVDRIRNGSFGEVHSMLIFKDGKLVLEEYFEGHDYKWDAPKHFGNLVVWDKDKLHYAHSISKSITSICVGIAIDKGFIKDVHQSIFEYLPDYQYLKTEKNKNITIEHLLTATSGLQWDEWHAPLSSIKNDQISIWFHENGPVDFVLKRPVVAVPGTRFIYSGGNVETLGVIVENASGMSFEDFSREYLFEPLRIDSAYWHIIYPSGEVHTAAGLRTTPREMVKIGVMMLNNGAWKGEQILSENWVRRSMYPFSGNKEINPPGEDLKNMGYSYTWWTKRIDYNGKTINWFSANGWGGQKIAVLPELNAVIVFTGARYNGKVREYKIFERYILPAFE